jgi:hypothetical protein
VENLKITEKDHEVYYDDTTILQIKSKMKYWEQEEEAHMTFTKHSFSQPSIISLMQLLTVKKHPPTTCHFSSVKGGHLWE